MISETPNILALPTANQTIIQLPIRFANGNFNLSKITVKYGMIYFETKKINIKKKICSEIITNNDVVCLVFDIPKSVKKNR